MRKQVFQKKVLDESREQPVLVDFWAPWCGPCKMLGPVLDTLDSEDDRWKLVKVNVDESTSVAQKYGIRSIPQVLLFSKGNKVAEFSGARSRAFIERWLEEQLPEEGGGTFETLQSRIKDLARDEALEELSNFIERYPDHAKAKLAHACLNALEHPGAVVEELEGIERNEAGYEIYEDASALEHFLEHNAEVSDPAGEKVSRAQKAFRDKNYSEALDYLIQGINIDRNYADDLMRKTCIAIFRLLGEEHTITRQHRKRFDMALY